jgi:hypothetical protein
MEDRTTTTTMGNCIYAKYQISISNSTYKEPGSDTQNNEYSLHTIIGRSKTNTTQIQRKYPSMQLPHTTNITTTVKQTNMY